MHLDLERIKLKLRILSIFFPDLTGRRLKIFEKIWTGIKITSSKKCQARISIESGGIRIQIKRKLRPRSSINTYGRVGSLTSHIKIPVFAGLVRQDGWTTSSPCLTWSSTSQSTSWTAQQGSAPTKGMELICENTGTPVAAQILPTLTLLKNRIY